MQYYYLHERGFEIHLEKGDERVRQNGTEVHSKIAINIRFGEKFSMNPTIGWDGGGRVMVHFDNGIAINIPRQ